MTTSSALRFQIEHALEHRFPAALTPAPRIFREVSATGVCEVDALLDGGIPVGAISELTGPDSSGRTSLAISFLAQRTSAEQVCAWVDASDNFDPESAAASGVLLRKLLWVRCRNTGHDSKIRPWTCLDQALRATDLLLQVGGFGSIVLDIGNIAPQFGRRIPLATWFRFRQSADRTRCCLVVLGKASYAQSSAALVLECAPSHEETAGETVLSSVSYVIQQSRERFVQFSPGVRKLPASTWSPRPAWE
jgi:hypothetical protein